MSLSGSFETLPITEVLGLLAGSQKTGALRLDADGAQGTVFIDDGWCSAAEDVAHMGPLETEKELETALVEVCFEVARHSGGSFAFEQDAAPAYESPVRVEVGVAVTELDDLLEQWQGIKVVVPSLEHRPRLVSTLDVPSIEFDPERWKLLVAIDGRRSVRQIITKLDGTVMEVCRELAALVEVGAVALSKSAKQKKFADVVDDDDEDAHDAHDAGHALIEPAAPYGPGVDDDSDDDTGMLDERAGSDPDEQAFAPREDKVFAELAELEHEADDEAVEVLSGTIDEIDEIDEIDGIDGIDEIDEVDGSGEVDSDLDDDVPGGPEDGAEVEGLGSAEDVAAAVEALKERGELPPDASPDEMRDRGALLRLFSALRDS